MLLVTLIIIVIVNEAVLRGKQVKDEGSPSE